MARRTSGSSFQLERDQDERVLRREWRFERVGWSALALVIAAGLAGLFGDGGLSTVAVSSPDGGAAMRHERVVRRNAPTEIELRLPAEAGGDTVAVVSVDDEYLRRTDVRRVTPEPLRVRAAGGRVEFHLLRVDPAQPMTVVLRVEGESMGLRRATIGTSHGPIFLRQLVLP